MHTQRLAFLFARQCVVPVARSRSQPKRALYARDSCSGSTQIRAKLDLCLKVNEANEMLLVAVHSRFKYYTFPRVRRGTMRPYVPLDLQQPS